MRYFALGLLLWSLPLSVQAETKIEIGYHAPTDLFLLMDGVTGWYFNDSSYHTYWKDRFGWSAEDRRIAKRYKKYRDRTYDRSDQKKRSHLFATRLSVSSKADPLADHFINATSIRTALASLHKNTSARDAAMLRSFYAHFQPKWRRLLRESEAFVRQARSLDRDLKKLRTSAYLDRLSRFYKVDKELVLRVRLVWWPPIDRSSADFTGSTLFLRRHPQHHKQDTGWLGVIMHEVAHHLSAHQPLGQKQSLSKAFLDVCSVRTGSGNTLKILEEPLAVAWGQAAFVKYVLKKTPDPAQSWYSHTGVDVMGRLIWLHLDVMYETDATIADGIILDVARDCERLTSLKAGSP